MPLWAASGRGPAAGGLLYPANRRMIVVQEPANAESRVIRLLRFRRELMIVLRRLNQREEATMARSGAVGVPLRRFSCEIG